MTRLLTTRHLLTEHSNPKTAPPPEAATMESDFVLILAALLCGLICLVGLAAMLRCAWLRQALTRSSTAREAAAANKGLKKKVLQTLPKYTYGSSILPQLEENDNSSSNNNNNNNNNSSNVGFKFACTSTECPICLGEFVEGDQLRVLPRCGHGFHVVCIDTWLGSHSSCPSCRQILVVARCHKCGHNALGTGNNCNNNNNNNSFLP